MSCECWYTNDGRALLTSEMTISHLANAIAFVKKCAADEATDHDEFYSLGNDTWYRDRAKHWVPILQAEFDRRMEAIEIRAAEITDRSVPLRSLSAVEFDWYVHGDNPPHAQPCVPETDDELAGCLAYWIENNL